MEDTESIFCRLLSAKQAGNEVRNDKISSQSMSPLSRSEIAQIPVEGISGFTYDPLDESVDSIRLLSFEEGCEGHDIIRCNLVHKTFREKPVYFALSYTWGQATDERLTIFVNGKPFRVRENLFRALKIIASPLFPHDDKDQPCTLLWIDAICINQQDPLERSKQVSIMDFVYSRASYVLVWLASEVPTGTPNVRFGNKHEQSWSEDDVEKFCIWVLSNPYWKRLWIIQEFVLAAGLRICIGNNIWTFEKFLTLMGIAVIFDYGLQEERVVIHNRVYGRQYEQEHIVQLVRERLERHKRSNRLDYLLKRFQYAQCQDRRDKIYGFLGIANDCHDGSLQPDYTKPMSEVFADVLCHFCRSGNLQSGALNAVDTQTRLIQHSRFISKLVGGDNWTTLTSGGNSKYEIQVRGAHCGEILHIGPTYEDMVSSAAANKNWTASFDTHYQSPGSNERIRIANEKYISVIIKDMDQERLARVQAFRLQPCYARIFRIWPTLFTSDKDNRTYRERRTSGGSTPCNNISKPLPKPRMFLGSGLVLGLAPGEAQVGDIICRFVNTDITALLRKEGYFGSYRLIGRIEVNDIPLLENLGTMGYVHAWLEYGGLPTGTHFILKLDLETLLLLIR